MGNLQRVRALVKQHVASSNEARTGQFLSAAARGETDRIKLMLQQGFQPDTADYDNRTALMLAAANGRKVGGRVCLLWAWALVSFACGGEPDEVVCAGGSLGRLNL
jgi:hypothetical protein